MGVKASEAFGWPGNQRENGRRLAILDGLGVGQFCHKRVDLKTESQSTSWKGLHKAFGDLWR